MAELIKAPCKGAMCWQVNTSEYRYNTEIEVGANISALLKFMDDNYALKGGEGGVIKQIIANTLVENKKKILFEKSKVDCVLYAKDDSACASVFWGLNIADIKGDEDKFYRLKTNGKYAIEVASIEKLLSMAKSNAESVMMERDLKSLMSANILDMIRICIERQINENKFEKLQGLKDETSKKIVAEINLKIAGYGIAVKDFNLGLFDFVEEEKKVFEELNLDEM